MKYYSKVVYPVLVVCKAEGTLVNVPDLRVETMCKGELYEAIQIARDLIGTTGRVYIEKNMKIPSASTEYYRNYFKWIYEDEETYLAFVDVDLEEYVKHLPLEKRLRTFHERVASEEELTILAELDNDISPIMNEY